MRPERETVDALTRVIVRTCRALAEAGRPQDAGRHAAEAWLVLRGTHPRQARHLDGAMHHIARLEHRLEQADADRRTAIETDRKHRDDH